MKTLAVVLLGAVVWGQQAAPQAGSPALIAVWYRGTPAGVPRLDDLAALRATGFMGITWPAQHAAALPELRRLAASVDLAVVTKSGLDVPIAPNAARLPAVVWRAIAHGTRVIAFDPGQKQGTGLTNGKGERLPWVQQAAAIANAVSANPRLIAGLKPGPPVTVPAPFSRFIEIALLDGGRGWVLVATNTSDTEVRTIVPMPPGIPAALWVSLVDGGMMSMLRESAGAKWTVTVKPGEALVYVIDKTES
jgi:hypothetical protein